nr:MAG TPA: hypothetical protein [Caudoviricetes sp.]
MINAPVKRNVYIGLISVYIWDSLRLIRFTRGLHWFTEGLHRPMRGITRTGNLLFFIVFLEKIKCYFILYNYYLVYLQRKIIDYGKGYTRTFDTWIAEYEAERLVFQQYFCRLYSIYA